MLNNVTNILNVASTTGSVGSSALATIASETKSGKDTSAFVGETFSDGKDKTDKKLPS